ncbi:hypothetical protein LTR53_010476 [Teratosphaeriaceae sp. CCFEE 6253]|nr:hypothetical protein LTR53_010476 [Teratosphaeriaceae sp. CCFEE 6253]
MGRRNRRKRARPPVPTPSFATDLKADPARPSLLLDLPAELRNLVYEHVCAGTGGAHLSHQSLRNRLRPLTPGSALARTNQQVRHELLAVACLVADVRTVVRDFDFRHLVTFLNRLSEVELAALSPSSSAASASIVLPAHRRVVVELVPHYGRAAELLMRWINRAAHPTKRGTRVRVEYVMSPVHARSGMVQNLAAGWAMQAVAMPAGRSREELERIVAACR